MTPKTPEARSAELFAQSYDLDYWLDEISNLAAAYLYRAKLG